MSDRTYNMKVCHHLEDREQSVYIAENVCVLDGQEEQYVVSTEGLRYEWLADRLSKDWKSGMVGWSLRGIVTAKSFMNY